MNFNKIDIDNWERKENYIWFTTQNKCNLNMTTNVDISNLVKFIKEKKIRFYPVFGYIISNIVNQTKEFKMSVDKEGNLGYWDVVYPRYPIFHDEDKRISILWTEYNENFNVFYNNFINDINTYGNIRSMAAKGMYPQNCFDITSMPWVSFSSFSCPDNREYLWLAPFIAIGKFFEDRNKIMLPVSVGISHAVSDGYHVSKFFIDFQNLANNFEKWLIINN